MNLLIEKIGVIHHRFISMHFILHYIMILVRILFGLDRENSFSSSAFPAAFLQFPFFDQDALKYDQTFPIEQNLFIDYRYLNYAGNIREQNEENLLKLILGIGVLIGHEMTHAFDDIGRYFDKDGNYISWWSNQTINEFNQLKKCFIQQYNQYTMKQINLTVSFLFSLRFDDFILVYFRFMENELKEKILRKMED